MFQIRFVCLMLAAVSLLGLGCVASAAEVECDATYCFSSEDFSQEEPLAGICIMELPEPETGTVMLNHRVLQPGDILTADQLAQMTFAPLRTEEDADAVVTYLPIYEDRVENSATMTISIRGKEDKAPVAEDFTLETYKNLPAEGRLKANDPEGEKLVYTVTRQPKRGEINICEDGSFTYTPKKNKVGVDSFVYTVTDPAGKVSREATVTIQILKPTDARQYTDTVGKSYRFAAEWMRNTGLFVGEQLNGESRFNPDKAVSRGEFLALVTEVLEIPTENDPVYTGLAAKAPDWLKPYLMAAVRSGLLTGTPAAESGEFDADGAVTEAEVAVMLQNVLDYEVAASVQADVTGKSDVPTWAGLSLQVMGEHGITLEAGEVLTRGRMAEILYTVSKLAEEAPGMTVIRQQQ